MAKKIVRKKSAKKPPSKKKVSKKKPAMKFTYGSPRKTKRVSNGGSATGVCEVQIVCNAVGQVQPLNIVFVEEERWRQVKVCTACHREMEKRGEWEMDGDAAREW